MRTYTHHTYTQHPEKDPDKVDFPDSYKEYFKHVTSFAIWTRIIDNLYRHSLGKLTKSEIDYIPESDTKMLFKETRLMVSLAVSPGQLAVPVIMYLYTPPGSLAGSNILSTGL